MFPYNYQRLENNSKRIGIKKLLCNSISVWWPSYNTVIGSLESPKYRDNWNLSQLFMRFAETRGMMWSLRGGKVFDWFEWLTQLFRLISEKSQCNQDGIHSGECRKKGLLGSPKNEHDIWNAREIFIKISNAMYQLTLLIHVADQITWCYSQGRSQFKGNKLKSNFRFY